MDDPTQDLLVRGILDLVRERTVSGVCHDRRANDITMLIPLRRIDRAQAQTYGQCAYQLALLVASLNLGVD